ncbi:hypothetical protein [Paenibacillus albus]|uniref:Uncharacterized protein n=1 Tax=Paenibacillus albus TaxID=2495582 RepID=A0A3S9ACA0_9BACL|nr:hypothetical protein [Paenibacillus albus]AZN43373.1 hypothetical protein EJC50_29530 [Paenibacillus albus]
MNKHDQSRKDALIKTLIKAKEQAETAKLYLSVNNRDTEDIAAASVALEYVEHALEQLGALVPAAM